MGLEGSFHYDVPSGEMHCTQGCALAFGQPPGWVPDSIDTYFNAIHADERPAFRARFTAMLGAAPAPAASASATRQRVVWPDGSIVELHCESMVEFDEQGRATAIVGSKRLIHVHHDAGRAPAALRRAASDIAHELRNLTGALRNQVRAQSAHPGPAQHPTGVDAIFLRMEQLSNELAQLEGRRPSAARWTELRRWLTTSEDLLRDALGPGRKLELTLPPVALFGLVATERLEQILMHLIGAARAGTREGGQVTVSLAPRSGGEQLVLRVTDDGEGMSQSAIDLALQRGIPAHVKRPGLGLALARDAVERLRGEMHVDSIEGRGTVVELLFDVGESPREQRD